MDSVKDAIIIGAGIAGLTASYLLSKKGKDIVTLDKSDHPGGPISSYREEGYLVERGPNSLLLPDPWVETLIADLGLTEELLETSEFAKKRFIIRNGKPIPVPGSPLQAIFSPLFSFKAKIGFLGEPFRRRLPDTEAASESVADFVTRRMGQEFLDYAINPFVSGVYAGDPEELVLRHAFPLMYGFERDGGSIIRGAMRYKKRKRQTGSEYKKRSISFKNGLGTLPIRLAERLGKRLSLNTHVKEIEYEEKRWTIRAEINGEQISFHSRTLIVCIPSHAIKLLPWPRSISERIEKSPDLPYPAVHSLALGFKREQIQHPLDGFGALAPTKERLNILGALFSSSLYPDRAPKGNVLLTVMMGGRQRPGLAQTSRESLESMAIEDLRTLLGLEGKPTFSRLVTWPKAIPQYIRNFGPWKEIINSIEEEYEGLECGGSAIDGIAMGASIMSGRRIAESLENF